MTLYIILILLALLCASTDVSPVKNRIVVTLPFIVLLFLMSALRDHMGGFDYDMYAIYYSRIVNIVDYFNGSYHSYFRTKNFEEGFVVLSSLIRTIDFTNGPYFFFFTLALITFGIFLPSLKEYTPYVFIAILFYLYKGYFWHNFTLVRQAASIAFFVYSIRYVRSKEYWKYIVFNLIAFSIHHAAVILIPLCFILNYKLSIKTILIMFSVAFVFCLSGPLMKDICMQIASIFGMGSRLASYISDKGTINPLNFCEILVILFVALFYRNDYEKKEPYFNIFLNLFIISSLILIAFSSFEIIARFKEYFVIAYMILVSYMVGHIENNRDRWVVFALFSFYVTVGYFRYLVFFREIPYKWLLW